jgi:hypothetical protein
LLESLVTNLPAGVHLASAEGIGDGGHILAHTDDGRLVQLVPGACPPPTTAAEEPSTGF